MVEYYYDAWGNHKVVDENGDEITSSTHIGNVNPFRYRGYYYDTETGLYFLQTRYYDPEVGRFLNRDSVQYADPETINGLNLYAYCLNNPVEYVDPTGQFWDTVLDIGFIAWGISDLINGGYSEFKNWIALGIDIIFAVIPFVPSGFGQVIKVGNKIDNAADIASTLHHVGNLTDINKLTFIGRNMNRVTDTAQLLNRTENLYKTW